MMATKRRRSTNADKNLEERVTALEEIFKEVQSHLEELGTLPRRGGSLNETTVEHYLDRIVESIARHSFGKDL